MVNITDPIYTSVSDSCYYCHLTDTGVWLCEGMNVYNVIASALGVGIILGALIILLAFLIINEA